MPSNQCSGGGQILLKGATGPPEVILRAGLSASDWT